MDIRTLSLEQILRSRKRLKRELLEAGALRPLRIAVLGGTTTQEVVDFLEIVLLADGVEPIVMQSEYNKFYEDATLDVARIADFKPDLVYLHTHYLNISRFAGVDCDEAGLRERISEEMARFEQVWESLHAAAGCQIIQNNFEHPPLTALGNFDAVASGGQTRLVYELNVAFSRFANDHRWLLVHDINALAARLGASRWFDWNRWFSYKMLTTPEASFELARSLGALAGAALGRTKKCLILDLDNTLWGGVIGDDGLDKIQIGRETAQAEAYTAFQEYCLALRSRGILLAVCSKNDDAIARSGFTHPDSVLKLEHFSAFHANWESKAENIERIAAELNLGLDSFVFVDDNPAERAIVAAQLPQVAVPEVGAEVAAFPSILAAGRYFETVGLSREDVARADAYTANQARAAGQAKFASYGDYLESLEMKAEIGPFQSVYLERITQLINKTNQFNLTTRRYTFAEVEQIAADDAYITLYGRLSDKFGDNGLISVIIGRRVHETVDIDLWIMSCRVLKRDMELAMLDALVEKAAATGARQLRGRYLRTPKNAMVEDHYRSLGFELIESDAAQGSSAWKLDLSSYVPRNRYIHLG